MYDFEWDNKKNNKNKLKHKIDFADAIQIFFDEHRITMFDYRHDYGENRYQVIGQSSQRILFVVYTERKGNTIRMISARKANKKEISAYKKGIF